MSNKPTQSRLPTLDQIAQVELAPKRKVHPRQAEMSRAWRARQGPEYQEKNRLRVLSSLRLKRYGLTVEAFDALFASQGRACAVCRSLEHGGKNWHVDHDHISDVVRGILCNGCNTALGQMRDSPTILRAAADYLEKHR